MPIIPLPNAITYESQGDSHSKVVITPLFPGYGTTIGNLLRRVLISSLHGTAIDSMKIANVEHEFSGIPHVKEDGVEIMMNVKKVRIKAHTAIEEPITLSLHVTGERQVTAGDIEAPSDVEIVNPDLVIATITDAVGALDMTFTVSQGRGYVTVEMQEEKKHDVGVIELDTQFSPIVSIGMEIENVRVGKMTNYDKLTLDIITDGTRTPEEAVQEAIDIILEQVNFLKEGPTETVSGTEETEPVEDDDESSESATEVEAPEIEEE